MTTKVRRSQTGNQGVKQGSKRGCVQFGVNILQYIREVSASWARVRPEGVKGAFVKEMTLLFFRE